MAKISMEWSRNVRTTLQAVTQEAVDDVLEASAGAAYEEGETIMGESKKIVPYESGALEESGKVADPVREGNTVRLLMGYGGASPGHEDVNVDDYALIQHEYYPVKRKPGRQWKYLETPFLAAATGMADRIAARIRERSRFT